MIISRTVGNKLYNSCKHLKRNHSIGRSWHKTKQQQQQQQQK